jgi:hypothetical protein
VDIIAGASLARPTVNLPLSVVKTGCGSRPSLRLGAVRSTTRLRWLFDSADVP